MNPDRSFPRDPECDQCYEAGAGKGTYHIKVKLPKGLLYDGHRPLSVSDHQYH